MGLILALVITVIVLAIGCVGIIGLIRWTRDPTMAKRLPGFNIFTGKWSDEEAVKDQRLGGESKSPAAWLKDTRTTAHRIQRSLKPRTPSPASFRAGAAS